MRIKSFGIGKNPAVRAVKYVLNNVSLYVIFNRVRMTRVIKRLKEIPSKDTKITKDKVFLHSLPPRGSTHKTIKTIYIFLGMANRIIHTLGR